MPELPEVETVLRTLENKIKDRKIKDVEVLYENIVDGDVLEFKNKLINQHFKEFERRGKYLIFKLDDIALVSHLRMEGKYYILPKDEPINKHTHVIFTLDNTLTLRYHDVRKFGRMELMALKDNYDDFKNLGPEPFSDKFNVSYINNYLKNKRKPIKEILLDQSFVSGIGNIYADEILYDIKVSPLRRCDKLNKKEIVSLISSTRKILNEAIKAGGTTIRSYTSSLGVTGRFQISLKCHTKEKCERCNKDIIKIRVGGRGTYYCRNCQK